MSSKLILSLVIFTGFVVLTSCEQFKLEPETDLYDKTFPAEVNFELPTAISSDEILKNFKVISGNAVHNYLRNFIFIGYEITEIINSTYKRLAAIDVEGLSEFSYTGVDGNIKHVSIREDNFHNSRHWDYYMEIYDNDFANLALQVFWNDSSTEQFVILKPNLLNHYKMQDHADVMFAFEYLGEASNHTYESSVYIGVSGLTISEQNPYAPNNIKLFFGLKDHLIDFTGSSNNPNASLYSTAIFGKNWLFRGKADPTENLALLELSLPETDIENTENIMTEFSLKNVILKELKEEYIYNGFTDTEILSDKNIDISTIDSPAWFNSEGFQSSGENVPDEYTHLSNFNTLAPFSPLEVRNDSVKFVIWLK